MLSVEVADELPGVMEAGVKVAVAPAGSPLAASVTGVVKAPFCAVAEMVYVAVPPGCTVCAEVDEPMVKLATTAAVPMPLRLVDCGEPAALSVT